MSLTDDTPSLVVTLHEYYLTGEKRCFNFLTSLEMMGKKGKRQVFKPEMLNFAICNKKVTEIFVCL